MVCALSRRAFEAGLAGCPVALAPAEEGARTPAVLAGDAVLPFESARSSNASLVRVSWCAQRIQLSVPLLSVVARGVARNCLRGAGERSDQSRSASSSAVPAGRSVASPGDSGGMLLAFCTFPPALPSAGPAFHYSPFHGTRMARAAARRDPGRARGPRAPPGIRRTPFARSRSSRESLRLPRPLGSPRSARFLSYVRHLQEVRSRVRSLELVHSKLRE